MNRLASRLTVVVLVLLAVAVGCVIFVRSLADGRFRSLEAEAARVLGPVTPGGYAPAPAADPPEGPTAATRLLERMPAFTYTDPPAPAVRRLARASAAEWSGEDLARARGEIRERAATLAALRGLPDLPLGTFDLDYEAGLNMRLPDVYTLLEHGLLLRLHAGSATLEGDLPAAVRSVEAQGTLVRLLAREAVVLLRLFDLRIERLQLWAIHDLLAAGLDDPALLTRLEASLLQRDPAETTRRMAGFELAVMLDLVRHQRRGLGRLAEESWVSSWLDSTVGPWLTVRALERHLETAEAAAQPWPRARRLLDDARPADLPGPYEDLVADFRLVVRGLQANAALRALANAALEIARSGACPETAGLPPEERRLSPFSGTALRVLGIEGGDCALSLPRDRELWDQEVDGEQPDAATLPTGWKPAPPPRLPWTWLVPAVVEPAAVEPAVVITGHGAPAGSS